MFREITHAEEVVGCLGHLWVVGIDNDPEPYGDGKAKILCHQYTANPDQPYTLAQIEFHLGCGNRVFHSDGPFKESDRWGLPTDPHIKTVIDAAVHEMQLAR